MTIIEQESILYFFKTYGVHNYNHNSGVYPVDFLTDTAYITRQAPIEPGEDVKFILNDYAAKGKIELQTVFIYRAESYDAISLRLSLKKKETIPVSPFSEPKNT